MDFEQRKAQAVKEVNEVIGKYNLGLQAVIVYREDGILPSLRFIDLTEQKENEETEKNKTTKRKK